MPVRLVTEDQLRAILRKSVGDVQRQWALAHEIDPGWLSHVLAGKYAPGHAIAAALGYESVMMYRKKGKATDESPDAAETAG